MFLVKEVANDLGMTPQAIYNQKEQLQQKGYMQRNVAGDWELTVERVQFFKGKTNKQT